MGAVIRAQPGENAVDVGLDRVLGDRQPVRHQFVGIAGGDELKDIDFADGKVVFTGVIGG